MPLACRATLSVIRKGDVRALIHGTPRPGAIRPPLSVLLALSLLAGPGRARAEEPRVAHASRIERGAVRVDGMLDEPAWGEAEPVSGFVQKTPNEGEPSTRRTEVAFLFDDEALYVGARMEIGGGEIRSIVSRRDNSGNAERLIVCLDTYHDRRTSASFAVTASGVRIDYFHPGDAEHDRDYSFDPVWEARASRSEEGWTAEMRIPFSQLRFTERGEPVFGLNMNRWMPDRNEDAYWVCIPKNETGWASRFGELRGIRGIRPSRRIELLPYAAADARFAGAIDPDDPFTMKQSFRGRAGTDLKMGLGPNLTLDGTINPDFGQIEADPAEVNLSAYETYFEERRPFFVEGNRLLAGDGAAWFYSRRIGARPRGEPDADWIDSPENTTILGAMKATGRLAGGLSIGALAAVTDEERARTASSTNGAREEVLVEPLAGYGVLRLQQEFGESRSTAGVILTGVERKIAEGEDLRNDLARRAVAGGADWKLTTRDKEYALTGYAGFSFVEGDSGAIARVQRSSAHYFQRPDASHVTLDSSRTSLSGNTFSLSASRVSGEHWLWEAGVNGESPGFETNDAGRLQSADDIGGGGNLKYRETKPGRIFREYSINLGTYQEWNYGGVRTHRSADLSFNCTWNNHWSGWCGIWGTPRNLSDDLTRGGPLMQRFRGWSSWIGASNSWASDARWLVESEIQGNEAGAKIGVFRGSLSTRTGGRWELSVEPRYIYSRIARQYIGSWDGGPEETYGRRYVFSWIEQGTLSARFRVNCAATPDLTLEVYAEPFASSGRHFDHGELRRPRDRSILTYGKEGGSTLVVNDDGSRTVAVDGATFTIDNQDFNVLSFRSNVVLRWEWRKGSTLFLVWQQNRESRTASGALVGGRDLWESFGAGGENLFVLKMSYWFPLG